MSLEASVCIFRAVAHSFFSSGEKPWKLEGFKATMKWEDTVVASERLALDNLPRYLPLVNVERNELILAEKKVKTDMIF